MPLPIHNLHSTAVHPFTMYWHLFHRNINDHLVHMGRLPLVCLLIHTPTHDMRPRHLHRHLPTGIPVRSNRNAILNIPPRVVVPNMQMQADDDVLPWALQWPLLDR